MDRHLRARRHALSRAVGQAPARCALAHGQRRVRAGPRGRAQLLPSDFPGGDRQGAEARGRRAAAVDRGMARARCWRRSPSASGRLESRPRAAAPAHGRGQAEAANREPRAPPSTEPPSDTPSLVPAPPDAPQPKGQLLDFIEALEEASPGVRRQEGAARGPGRAGTGLQRRLRCGSPRASSSGSATGRRASSPRASRPPPGQAVAAYRRASSVPPPAVLVRRAPPRPRRVRGWRVPSRRWRSLLYKLLIGLGIAGLAVAYQDQLPHVEGRGANVVSSQAADLAPATRIIGPQRRGDRPSPPTTRDAGSSRSAPTARSRCGTRARARWCAPSSSTKAPATALAVDERRALTGHKGGAIVLWDLERAEKLGVFQHQEAPISALAFTGDPEPVRRRRPGRRGGAVRHPHALGAGGRCSRARTVRAGDRQRPAGAASLRPARIAASSCGAPIRAASRAPGAGRATCRARSTSRPAAAQSPAAAPAARCGSGPPPPRARSARSRRMRAASPRSPSPPATTGCSPRPATTDR